MFRRDFLLGAGASALVANHIACTRRRNFTADWIIRKLDRANYDVYISYPDTKVNATGWKLKVEKGVLWELIAWNPGPKLVRYTLAEPGQGDWRIVGQMEAQPGWNGDLIKRWRPDYEDLFLYAETQSSAAPIRWDVVNGDVSNSNASLIGSNTVCDMTWNTPQELHLQMKLGSVPL